MPEMQIGEKETLRRELDETRQLLRESEHREQKLREKVERLTSRGFQDLHHENETLRKQLEAVEAVHGGLEATLPALSPVEQAIIKAYGKALKGEQCRIYVITPSHDE